MRNYVIVKGLPKTIFLSIYYWCKLKLLPSIYFLDLKHLKAFVKGKRVNSYNNLNFLRL